MLDDYRDLRTKADLFVKKLDETRGNKKSRNCKKKFIFKGIKNNLKKVKTLSLSLTTHTHTLSHLSHSLSLSHTHTCLYLSHSFLFFNRFCGH